MKPVEELTFVDDFMFGHVMKNREICKGFLERLLNIKISKLEYPELQKTISPHYEAKGVRLDVYVEDSSRAFDIEVQNILEDDLPKRTRYYQSIMDIDLLLKGKKYAELKENFVIFICNEDFFDEDLPCYTFTNICHEKTTLELKDGSHKIIFNATAFMKEKDLEKKAILEYINNKKSTSAFTKKIDNIVETAKKSEIFRGDYMTWGLAEQDAERRGFKAGLEKGVEQGLQQKAIETARNMLKNDISLEIVAQCTGLPLEKVKELSES